MEYRYIKPGVSFDAGNYGRLSVGVRVLPKEKLHVDVYENWRNSSIPTDYTVGEDWGEVTKITCHIGQDGSPPKYVLSIEFSEEDVVTLLVGPDSSWVSKTFFVEEED